MLLDSTVTSHMLEGDHPIHYHEAGPGAGVPQDSADALLLLHGSGPGVSGWSNFRGNLPVLSGQFRTVLPDLPGFGRSALPPLEAAYPRVAAESAVRLLDALGIATTDLLGNSMGGYVALELALAHPDRVRRIVLMGPGGLAANLLAPEPSEGARRLADFMQNPSREAMVAWVDTMVSNKAVVDDELIDERLAAATRPGAMESTMAIFGSLYAHPEPLPLWARLERVTQPTLVTWGRDDRMVPFDGALFGFRRLRNAELHVFSGCGHWAQVERKAEFERVVIEFLTRS